MPRQAERQFGAMPEWAKKGPISARNYGYRAEAHCALKSAERKGIHPTITLQSPDFKLWYEYFTTHLGKLPLAFVFLLDATILEMTLPEPVPMWFDPSFEPTPNFVVPSRVVESIWTKRANEGEAA